MIRVIGLTGGIATGKSTVSQMLRDHGAHVLDADELARVVVQPGKPALTEIAARFPGVVAKDGTLDRGALGARVFSNEQDRAALNAITHPRIAQEFQRRVAALEAQGIPWAVYDAALLVENKLQGMLNGVIVVSAPEDVQRERLMRRNGMSAQEANARIRSQLPMAEKLKHATWVVNNGGELASTATQVAKLYQELCSAPR